MKSHTEYINLYNSSIRQRERLNKVYTAQISQNSKEIREFFLFLQIHLLFVTTICFLIFNIPEDIFNVYSLIFVFITIIGTIFIEIYIKKLKKIATSKIKGLSI